MQQWLMDFEWIFILTIPIIVTVGAIVRLVRARRQGLRGKKLFVSVMKPVSIAMQGESLKVGLPVARLEPENPPTAIAQTLTEGDEFASARLKSRTLHAQK